MTYCQLVKPISTSVTSSWLSKVYVDGFTYTAGCPKTWCFFHSPNQSNEHDCSRPHCLCTYRDRRCSFLRILSARTWNGSDFTCHDRSICWMDELVSAFRTNHEYNTPPFDLASGNHIGHVYPTYESDSTRKRPAASINYINSTQKDEEEFRTIVEEFNVNPELSNREQETMLHVLYQNRHAFAYGSRNLAKPIWSRWLSIQEIPRLSPLRLITPHPMAEKLLKKPLPNHKATTLLKPPTLPGHHPPSWSIRKE